MTDRRCYEFGPFRLDPAEKLLFQDGRPVSLPPKAFDTLCMLVEQGGRLATKDDLLARVWTGTFVEEVTVAQSISVLRKALGDTPDEPRYIETVPKHGYRFVGAVRQVDASPPTRRPSRWPWAAIVGGLVLLMGWAGFQWTERRAASTPVAPRTLLLVLPFTNLSGDPNEEYLSDGLTEELIAHMSRLHPNRLGVIARTSAMHYKNTRLSIADIGRELPIAYVLEGSVRQEGRRLRITAQLIQVKDQTHVWSETYERDRGEILLLQSLVARAVGSQIQSKMSLPETTEPIGQPTLNSAAWDLYLRARYFWGKRNNELAVKAIGLYQQAIALDPEFAQAHAEMGACQLTVGGTGAYERAEEASRKALDIDAHHAGAHATLATVAMHRFDWRVVDQEFKRAEELNPLFWNIDFLLMSGRFDDALGHARTEVAVDPANWLHYHGMGIIHFYARRYDQAIQQYLEALDLEPQSSTTQLRLAQAYGETHQYQQAIDIFMKVDSRNLTLLRVYALAGQREDALAGLAAVVPGPLGRGAAYDIALVYAALADKEEVFRWLNIAYEERAYHLIYLKVDPRFDGIRADSRFSTLVQRIGFPES